MPRTLVICSDGTGNSATGNVPSNVKRLFDLIVQGGPDQVAIYDKGVGTDRWQRGENPFTYVRHHLAELCVGQGVAQKLLELYIWLAKLYQPEDRIFLFGFSRGAFTVRALAGLVHVCGIVRREHIQLAPDAIHLYEGSEERIIVRRREQGLPPAFCQEESDHGAADAVAQAFKAQYCHPCQQVEFLGIWDTVKAYGWLRPKSFPALRHNPSVRKVRHAAALDDHRALFQMTGWGEGHPDVKEVWFAGDHADVGGGHENGNSSLTDAALHWMLGEAMAERLLLKPDAGAAIEMIVNTSASASRTPARSLWIRGGFILLDLLPRQELDNTTYPPRRPWRILWLNGARKPGNHPFHDTVSVHHTVEARMLVGDRRYTRKRLTLRSRRRNGIQVIQLRSEQDLEVGPLSLETA